MDVAETPSGSATLESELERLIDKGLDIVEPGLCSPPARSRSPRLDRVLGGPLHIEKLLLEVEEHHSEANATLAKLTDLRSQKEKELRHIQLREEEASATLERTKTGVASLDSLVKKVGGQHGWLANILGRCEEAESNRFFEGNVAEVFSVAVAKLREVRNLQNVQLQDAYVAQRQATEARETSSRDLSGLEASLAETREALARIEQDARTVERKINRHASQLQHLQAVAHMEQELSHLRSEIARGEQALTEARNIRDDAKHNMDSYSNWSGDLASFFRGHGVRDVAAITRGLQVLLPSDPLPMMIRTMLTQPCLDVRSPTVVSMFDLVSERLRGAESYLHRQFQESDAAFQDANRQVLQTSKTLREQEDKLSIRLAQSTFNLIATPSKNRLRSEGHYNSNRYVDIRPTTSDYSSDALVKVEPPCHEAKPSTAPKRPSISSVLNGTSGVRPSRS